MTQSSPISRSDEMLSAAAVLFAAKGFRGVTVDDIGAAVGLSGPALYHHFSSKEALLAEMLVSVNEGLRDQAAECASGDPVATLAALCTTLIDFALDRPELITIHKRDLIHAPDDVQRRVRRLKAEYVDHWVAAMCGLGVVDEPAAHAAVQAVIGLILSAPFSKGLVRAEMARILDEMAVGSLDAFLAGAGVETSIARSPAEG
jgi:AcrR family transcriptional regulator